MGGGGGGGSVLRGQHIFVFSYRKQTVHIKDCGFVLFCVLIISTSVFFVTRKYVCFRRELLKRKKN